MKINKKALQLIEKGLSSKTVSKLSESQIDVLHSKLMNEQPQPQVVNKTVKQIVLPSGSQTTVGGVSVSNIGGKTTVTPTSEGELDEDDTLNITQDPDATDDGMGIFEKENEDGPNPWAICHAQVGPKKTRKFERCVQSVKKQLKEGKNPVSLYLESQIEKIVEKHIPPRITKGDLLKVISETTTAPVKEPVTKPTTKPKTRPSHPGKNPNPGENPAPKAKKSETKEQKTAPEPVTIPAPTKPDTKPRVRPRHPGQNPNPGENPPPKAKNISPEEAKDKVIDVIMKLLEK